MYPYFDPHFKNNEAGLTLEGQFASIKVINLAGKMSTCWTTLLIQQNILRLNLSGRFMGVWLLPG